ncbi:hypothetical protein L3Y19_gp103 [Gordonia phage Neville]|uniref:Uncharacterized protein n=1 Tax=Gordonia phage Neville TaxID=2301693 RepID=A0A385DYI8_9CAUD|nr:hypothetical protein L3Y19_gp103 [Gordonia phage Neville]AXQ64501.1 hypothetical protein SEA_NEVILLE_127 [Gordonia phage Neville]
MIERDILAFGFGVSRFFCVSAQINCLLGPDIIAY